MLFTVLFHICNVISNLRKIKIFLKPFNFSTKQVLGKNIILSLLNVTVMLFF